MKSTSIHTLNIDYNRTKKRKKLWKILNFANISFCPNHASNLDIRNFSPSLTDNDWSKVAANSSPGRVLSNFFWLKLDWAAIQKELGEVYVFDVGCGNGNYGVKLQDFSQHRITKYVGGDRQIHDNWATLRAQHQFISLKQLNSNDIYSLIPERTNLFMSQSAIEHFEEDLTFFQQIRQYIHYTQRTVIQIHLFPSKIHLRLSPLHGVRQYCPRMISKITRLFTDAHSYSILFNLGGDECNTLHDQFITAPKYRAKDKTLKRDRRKTEPQTYAKLLRKAVEHDITDPKIKEPHSYALVIHSNYTEQIFTSMKSLTQ